MRKIGLGLLKHEKTSRRGLLGQRKRAGWDEQSLLKVLEAGARAELAGPGQLGGG